MTMTIEDDDDLGTIARKVSDELARANVKGQEVLEVVALIILPGANAEKLSRAIDMLDVIKKGLKD